MSLKHSSPCLAKVRISISLYFTSPVPLFFLAKGMENISTCRIQKSRIQECLCDTQLVCSAIFNNAVFIHLLRVLMQSSTKPVVLEVLLHN